MLIDISLHADRGFKKSTNPLLPIMLHWQIKATKMKKKLKNQIDVKGRLLVAKARNKCR